MIKIFFKTLLSICLLMQFTLMPVMAADRSGDGSTHDTSAGADEPTGGENGRPNDDQNSCNSMGSPVYLKNRSFVWSDTDVFIPGRMPLSLTRTYNSFDARVGIFGKGWTEECERSLLRVIDATVPGNETTYKYIYRDADGRTFDFTSQGGTYAPPSARSSLTLTERPEGGATLTDNNGNASAFNSRGQLVSDQDANGNALFYEYENGTLTQIADEHNRSLRFDYHASGQVRQVSDHSGRSWTYTYTIHGELESVTNPLGHVKRYEYTQFSLENSSAELSLLTKVIDESGKVVTNVVYDQEAGMVTSYTELGETWTYTDITKRNRPQTIQKTNGGSFTYRYILDEDGRKTEVRDPEQDTVASQYDDAGNQTSYTDEEGVTYLTEYDSLNRVQKSTTPLGDTLIDYHEQTDFPEQVTSPTGRVTQFSYDESFNLASIIDPEGTSTALTYNEQGDVLTITNALDETTTFTYTPEGYPLTVTDPGNNTTTFSHDSRGNLSSITHPEGQIVYTYDDVGRRLTSQDELGRVTTYNYDPAGRLTKVIAPNGAETTWGYDEFGRQSVRTDFDGLSETRTYGEANLIEDIADKAGNVFNHRWNGKYQLTRITTPEGQFNYSYDSRGLLIGASNPTLSVTREYDNLGRIAEEDTNRTRAVTYEFNNENELIRQTAFDQDTIYTRDNRGLLSSITAAHGQYVFSRDTLGRRTQLTRPSGEVTNYTWDNIGRLATLGHSGAYTTNFTYTYDTIHRIRQITGDGAPKSYGYNSASELTSVADNTGTYGFSHDLLGNRVNDGGIYDAANKLLENNQFTLTYDISGNVTSKVNKQSGARNTYQWNSLNQLVRFEKYENADSLTPISVREFGYGPLGRRTWREVNGQPREYFMYSGEDVIAIVRRNGNTVDAEFLHGPGIDEPLSMREGEQTYEYFTDHLGSIKSLTTDSGISSEYDYMAFGQRVVSQQSDASVQSHYTYTGREFEEQDLYYYRARYYDPEIGRFLSIDPIRLNGGLNEYLYVKSNPTNFKDPDGESPLAILLIFCALKSQYCTEVAGGTKDFIDNYGDMIDANTIGGDKYFHCKANCEAAKRGEGGKDISHCISDTREWFDQRWPKYDPPSASAADQVANQHGRTEGSKSNHSTCVEICEKFRPNGLPGKY